MPKKIKLSLLLFLFFSLFFHLALFLVFYFFPILKSENQSKEDTASQTRFEILPIQLADIPKPKQEIKPQQARFVSQYNSSVKHETTALQSQKNKSVQTPQSEHKQKSSNSQSSKNKKIASRTLNTQVPTQEKPTSTSKKQGTLFTPDLKGFDFSKKKEAGSEFFHDFLPSIQGGPVTSINSFADPRGPYFSMLKRKFRLRFDPAPPLRTYFQSHKIQSKRISTTMRVTVDQYGNLRHIKVLKSSGIGVYDFECVDTIRDSSPFSAPPKSYLKDGHLDMNWTFIVYIQ